MQEYRNTKKSKRTQFTKGFHLINLQYPIYNSKNEPIFPIFQSVGWAMPTRNFYHLVFF
jgi:hypothetical protein